MDSTRDTRPLSQQLGTDLTTLYALIRTSVILESQANPSPESVRELGQQLVTFGQHLTATGDRVIIASGRR